MRLDRHVVMGFKAVGKADDKGTFVEGPLKDQIRVLLIWLSKQEMPKRIDIAIGRDLNTVKNKILESTGANSMYLDEAMALTEQLINSKLDSINENDIESQTLDVDPEDDWSD